MNYETNLSADSSVVPSSLRWPALCRSLLQGKGIWTEAVPEWDRELPRTSGPRVNDGVRITVVNAETGEAAAPSVDFSNKSFSKPIFHFEKYSKLDYRAGAALTPAQGNYPYHIPAATIPYIMTSNTHPANIQAIRQYFCSEFAAKIGIRRNRTWNMKR